MFSLFRKKEETSYNSLRLKWEKRHRNLHERFWANHKNALEKFLSGPKQFLFGSLAGVLMLTAPIATSQAATIQPTFQSPYRDLDNTTKLMLDLFDYMPREIRPLTPNEEQTIGKILSQHVGFRVTAELQGIKLNRSYGLIGQEQHLYRYPGDSLYDHFDTAEDTILYANQGIAPGLGAWGYFAPSKQTFTQEDKMREKYYIAVQTFLAPGYNDHVSEYNQFFKYRKMLVVNPDNGRALVADIADSGPSEWTGKHLGGSPEVMHYLERQDGDKKGPVLYFFVDDPQNQIPLGPVTL
jgi:hypothetical protein